MTANELEYKGTAVKSAEVYNTIVNSLTAVDSIAKNTIGLVADTGSIVMKCDCSTLTDKTAIGIWDNRQETLDNYDLQLKRWEQQNPNIYIDKVVYRDFPSTGEQCSHEANFDLLI